MSLGDPSSRRTENTKTTGQQVTLALVLVLVIVYVTLFSVLAVSKHDAFETSAYDLGNYDQTIWNTIHGRPFRFTNMPGMDSRLALHFEPILLPLSLSYLVYSDPRTLLVLQTVMVGLGALPVFWLAREKLNSDLAALVFSLAYLLFPALEKANLFDFHAVTLAAPFLLYAFYFLQSKRYGLFTLFAILAMSCKEDIPLLVAMLGIYMFVFQKARKAGVLTFVGSGCWFYIAMFLIQPRFSPIGQNIHLERYAHLGQTPQEMVSTVLTQPGLIWEQLTVEARAGHYLCQLLMPVAFTSLLSPQTFLISLPSLAINLLSQYRPMHEMNKYHYAAPLVPFVIISGIYGTEFLAQMTSKWLNSSLKKAIHCLTGLILVCSLIYHYFYGFTPLAQRFRFYRITDHDRLGEELVALVPPEAAVSAHWKLNPHLSQREKIYMFPRIEDAEYVFLDVTRDSWPVHPVELCERVNQLLREGYGIRASQDGYILLQKGLANATELNDSFYDFARFEHLQVEYPMVVDFGERLRFLGLDLILEEEPELKTISLRLYWQALQPLKRDHYIYPFFFDSETGQIIEDTVERPMTTMIWYPTSQWQVGEVISMQTLLWDMKSRFKIGLGVIDGTHWHLDPRLPLKVVDSSLIIRPFDHSTGLELIEFRDYQFTDNRRLFEIPPIPHPLRADLGSKVALLGYDLKPTRIKPGETLHLTLYWQALTTMKTSYTVFTHLLDGENKLWAQHDSQPVGGIHPTSAWAEGEIVRDDYSLLVPDDAPKGEYLIEVGMYEWQTGQRLPVFDELGTPMPEDRVVLRRIQVVGRK
jgi:uncharacterized membrane protein